VDCLHWGTICLVLKDGTAWPPFGVACPAHPTGQLGNVLDNGVTKYFPNTCNKRILIMKTPKDSTFLANLLPPLHAAGSTATVIKTAWAQVETANPYKLVFKDGGWVGKVEYGAGGVF